MLFRGVLVATLAVAALSLAAPADAGSRERAVSPLVVPPVPNDPLYPIGMPLAGAFIVSQPHCRPNDRSDTCRTMFYFQGRFAERPDIFYKIRKR